MLYFRASQAYFGPSNVGAGWREPNRPIPKNKPDAGKHSPDLQKFRHRVGGSPGWGFTSGRFRPIWGPPKLPSSPNAEYTKQIRSGRNAIRFRNISPPGWVFLAGGLIIWDVVGLFGRADVGEGWWELGGWRRQNIAVSRKYDPKMAIGRCALGDFRTGSPMAAPFQVASLSGFGVKALCVTPNGRDYQMLGPRTRAMGVPDVVWRDLNVTEITWVATYLAKCAAW